jgi:hypothetical protein
MGGFGGGAASPVATEKRKTSVFSYLWGMHFYKQYVFTGKSIREVDSQAKKEFSTQHICDKKVIPKFKPSTSSTKVNNLIA